MWHEGGCVSRVVSLLMMLMYVFTDTDSCWRTKKRHDDDLTYHDHRDNFFPVWHFSPSLPLHLLESEVFSLLFLVSIMYISPPPSPSCHQLPYTTHHTLAHPSIFLQHPSLNHPHKTWVLEDVLEIEDVRWWWCLSFSRLRLFWKISPNDSRVERGVSQSLAFSSKHHFILLLFCWYFLLVSFPPPHLSPLFSFLTRSLYLFKNFSIFSLILDFNHRYILSYLSSRDNKIDWLSEHERLFWTSDDNDHHQSPSLPFHSFSTLIRQICPSLEMPRTTSRQPRIYSRGTHLNVHHM